MLQAIILYEPVFVNENTSMLNLFLMVCIKIITLVSFDLLITVGLSKPVLVQLHISKLDADDVVTNSDRE